MAPHGRSDPARNRHALEAAGIVGPWPADEYLWDGGEKYPVVVNSDLEIKGLALEDTIVHYDTIDGRTVVEPSNRVVLYSPRFGAVRQVTAALASQQEQGTGPGRQTRRPGAVSRKTSSPALPCSRCNRSARSARNWSASKRETNSRFASPTVCGRQRWKIICCRSRISTSFASACLRSRSKPRCNSASQAAITWSHDQAVQVILDRQSAAVETGDQRAQATFTVDTPNHPRLRVIKLASTTMARPGEFVDFTIRFDNIGDQTIGNVTLVDNLTTRLEYVEGSAESSLAAEFSASPNEGDSLLLRWEFADPVAAGDGGIVRFRCRVR